ncbi:MAG: hypothetical protein H8E72_02660 [Candidatus Marinimicrobia bacterium]|nr:hypothetical protein [Candidatus Neomarinimicrobiota bacterium]
MRITPLQLATLLILVGCNQDQNRFDVKSREFNQKSSHHYSEKFDNRNEDGIEFESPIDSMKPNIKPEPVQETPQLTNNEQSDDVGMFAGFFSIFSSSEVKMDSLDKVINDCEERLYTSADAANSQQSAINSLIGERNYLLRQLDSLQTAIVQSKKTSNKRVVKLEDDQRKLKSLIELLSSEIE